MGISKRQSYVSLREKGAEKLKFSWKKLFDSQNDVLKVWNKLFLVCCILAISFDPLLFYVPYLDDQMHCLDIEPDVAMVATMLRTILDAFYSIQIFFQYRAAFVSPASQVYGRGMHVTDSSEIGRHYFRGMFLLDLISILPLPQLVIWRYLFTHVGVRRTKDLILFTVLLQYIPRLVRIFPLASELKKTAGVFVQSSFYGVVFCLMLSVLSSHILGSIWYLLALRRNVICWDKACDASKVCMPDYLHCTNDDKKWAISAQWMNISELFINNACSIKNDESLSLDVVKFGIYKQALESDIFSKNNFLSKYIYCVWWGLQNMSTLGQGLEPSMDPGEISFTIALAVFGIVFFGLLIGNVQIYLQSLTIKMDETRLQRRNAEEWMEHRVIPGVLKQRFRRYEQYRWIETRGVDEESLVQSLSTDLRKDIKKHLRLPLLKRVPLFTSMDKRLLEAICERLKPSFYIENTQILCEEDPVDEILFIVRGKLKSMTTNGRESGFYSPTVLKEGDFCGDELLIWSLDSQTGSTLPLSFHSIQALTEVEALVLSSEDIKFVYSQFRHLCSRQFQQISRFYSQEWRTWAACYIQAAWRRYTIIKKLQIHHGASSSLGLGAIVYASHFAALSLRVLQRIRNPRYVVELHMSTKPQPKVTEK